MKDVLDLHRQLNVVCWSKVDWTSVSGKNRAGEVTEGFWRSEQPRYIHLSPDTCSNLQALIDSRRINGNRAFATVTIMHETAHLYGVTSEAHANCDGVQLARYFALELRFSEGQALRIERLAVRRTRATAPRGYWDAQRCRDGGAWDLFTASNLNY
jgi:hypothetical protein